MSGVLDQLDDPQHGRGGDGEYLGLVVEADVAVRPRHVEGQAGLAHALDGLLELADDPAFWGRRS